MHSEGEAPVTANLGTTPLEAFIDAETAKMYRNEQALTEENLFSQANDLIAELEALNATFGGRQDVLLS